MIQIYINKEDKEYAERIEELAEMAVVMEDNKSFSSEELQVIQIGATFATPVIAAISNIFIEMWKHKKGYSIKIGNDEFSCTGFSKKETMKLVEKYAPYYFEKASSEEIMMSGAITEFLKLDAMSEKDDTHEQE